MSKVPYSDLRQDYGREALERKHLAADPILQFERWFADASSHKDILEPNAMTLATSDFRGDVSARIVLLKGVDAGGFRFFTNYESYKGRQLAENPRAALVLHWAALERQVKIQGSIEKLPKADSEAYFQSRPRGSQLGAWASAQSEVITEHLDLENRFAELEKKYAGKPIPLPPFWGGYLLRPSVVEFWQGRQNRLHDCFRYRKEDSTWVIERLSP